VLNVDEAHAYDAYMGIELARLLEFHAAMGGSAIVLSATLTAAQRADLCNAFRIGLGCDPITMAPTEAYPAATVVSAAGVTTTALELADDLRRSVAVGRVATMEVAADEIVAASAAGAAVAWVRNTVDDAIEACELLRGRGLAPLLFHARYAMGDRLAIEREVLRLFGPRSTPETRRGRVLVATQVIEQSLDLDFDLLVSDLAPADLIIQRAGRLWRHPWRTERDGRPVGAPRLLLLSPEPVDDPPAAWLDDARTRFVYDNPAVLWRSARALLGAGTITTPDNIRSLVEDAYDEANTPAGLTAATQRAEGREGAARGIGLQNVLTFEQPYDRAAGLWEPDDRTPTRLGDARTTLRLAVLENGTVRPLCDGAHAWHLSEVSVLASRVADVVNDAAAAQAVEALRADWPRWEREIPVLVLRPVGVETWQGRVVDATGARQDVVYSRAAGLRFVR
jgi:CRISPR-associated endonuclease/helicase Cas3